MANEILRIKEEYAQREHRLSGSDRYSRFNPGYLYMMQQLERETMSLLRWNSTTSLENSRILEIGCGQGNVLLDFLSYGAAARHLFGVDLLQERLKQARARMPEAQFVGADGGRLPSISDTFDLVLQFTALSSVLDINMRKSIAAEMIRVLRKPGGMILWYDFWVNPTNPQTRGIPSREIRELFPGCTIKLRKITLAPPLARRFVPKSWMFALFRTPAHF